ncbi:MAG TPA: secretin N-terminal domain-containing protein [Burkholderiales bacterium]|nr:secretin N-terminal domain-containing protein [Burkholderiales bacterium]
MRRIVCCLLLLLCAGCAADTALNEGRRLIDQGSMEEGIRHLEKGNKAHPEDPVLRSYYLRYRDAYVDQLNYEGDKARLLGHGEQALAAYGRALEFNPDNARARAGLDATKAGERQRETVRQAQALSDAGNDEQALSLLKTVLQDNPSQREAQALQRRIEQNRASKKTAEPQLRPEFRKPVTLEFRDALLKNVFEVLSRVSGINFVFDRDVRADLRTTIMVRDTPLEEALQFLLVTNQLDKKILNQNTILIYPNQPNKLRDYQELVTRSFYLGNADVKQTLNLVKTVLKTRDVFIDERLNLLVMRDTPDAIRLAEKLIAAQDLAEPEVILEMKVLEITRSKLQNLGANYPNRIAAGVQGAAGVPGQITLNEWLNRSSSLAVINITDPAFIINLQQQDSDTNLLANPRIRVRNREKAKIHIGDRLPVITTTSTANVGVSESVQYLDIGLKLDIEPNVYLDDEVAMKVGLEVSNIVQQIQSAQGTLTYRLGTRNTATTLRVANGETQVLAGLIQDEERRTADKVPGLANIPLLGRLFTNNNDARTKTEIVLLITPYVVRNVDRPPPSALEVASGTEGGFGVAPLRLSTADGLPAPAMDNTPATASRPAQEYATAQPPAATGTAQAQTAAAQPAPAPPDAGKTLALSAPSQVRAGSDFAVAVSMPPGTSGSVRLDLVYDSAKLLALGAEGTPGRVSINVAGPTTVRFRALEGQSGSAQIAVGSIIPAAGANAAAAPISAPAPLTIDIMR